MSDNYFNQLNAVNVADHIEKKNGLSYLSWAWAWGELKKRFPDATYTVYENNDGWNYFHDGSTAWVKTGVTVNGIEHIEYLPVMDFRNKSIPISNITSFDVNKTIQRSLTKAVARHGLGLYIYAGEDLPEASDDPVQAEKAAPKKVPAKKETAKKPAENAVHKCARCGDALQPITGKDGQPITPDALAQMSAKRFGAVYCPECQRAALAAKKAKAAG